MSFSGGDGDVAFTKHDPGAPEGFHAVEAAGLHWLADASDSGGVVVPRPLSVHRTGLSLPLISSIAPSAAAAEGFGRRLAATHAAGAPYLGSPPAGWDGDGYIGPLRLPHVTTSTRPDKRPSTWGVFFARYRIDPFRRTAVERGTLTPRDDHAVLDVVARLEGGDASLIGPEPRPARLHGDLWSGNVMWSPTGVVLIDPAAHGGHAETDLAMLALFGLPHLSRVIAAYDEAAPLAEGWRQRVALHQLHPLLVHAALFGGGYGASAGNAARATVR